MSPVMAHVVSRAENGRTLVGSLDLTPDKLQYRGLPSRRLFTQLLIFTVVDTFAIDKQRTIIGNL